MKIPVIDFLSNSVSEFEENCISVLVKSNVIFNGFGSSSDSMFNGLQRTWWEVFQDGNGCNGCNGVMTGFQKGLETQIIHCRQEEYSP